MPRDAAALPPNTNGEESIRKCGGFLARSDPDWNGCKFATDAKGAQTALIAGCAL